MFDKYFRERNYLRSAKAIFNTPEGQQVLAHLKSIYVDGSALGSSERETYYKIGQQDLVKGLVGLANDPRDIDDIIKSYESLQETPYE